MATLKLILGIKDHSKCMLGDSRYTCVFQLRHLEVQKVQINAMPTDILADYRTFVMGKILLSHVSKPWIYITYIHLLQELVFGIILVYCPGERLCHNLMCHGLQILTVFS